MSKGLWYMAASALFFSVMSLLVKVAGQRLPSQEIVFSRSAVILVIAYASLKYLGERPWGEDKKLLLLRGVTGFIALSCFYYALTHLPLADATLIMFSNPVFTAILAAIFLGERLSWAEIGGLVASLAGVALITEPSFLFGGTSRLDPFAVGVALAGALSAATSYVLVRRLRETESPMVVVFWFALVATPASIAPAWPVALVPTWTEVAVLVAIGVVTHVAQVTMTKGLHLERAGRATAVTYLQVVFAYAWGMLFFEEFPTGLSVAGALLIVGSTLVVARTRRTA